METLYKKFQHHSWFKEGVTVAYALDAFAESGDFILGKKTSKKQNNNLLDPVNYDDIIQYAGKEGGTYRLNPEEKEYYLQRCEYWRKEKDRKNKEYLAERVNFDDLLEEYLRSNSLFNMERAIKERNTFIKKGSEWEEQIKYWQLQYLVRESNCFVLGRVLLDYKTPVKNRSDFKEFKEYLETKISEKHNTDIFYIATGDIHHLMPKYEKLNMLNPKIFEFTNI